MKERGTNIPTLDPYMLKMKLLHTGGQSFIPHIYSSHYQFHINRLEDYIEKMQGHLDAELLPFRLTVFSFMYLNQGNTRRSKGLISYEFDAGSFFFVPAFEITSHDIISKDIRGFYCHFDLDLLSFEYRLKDLLTDFPFLNFHCHPVLIVPERLRGQVSYLLERLESEYRKGEFCRMEVIRAYLIALFVEVLPFFETAPNTTDNLARQITHRFKLALTQHIYEKQKPEEYAALLRVSTDRLKEFVKSTTGKGAGELINDMILLESRILLKQTSLSVSEISYKLGQKHISNFSRFFKIRMGMSPGEYRNIATQIK